MAKVVRPFLLRDDTEDFPPSAPSTGASVSKRWKFRRNAVIVVAHVQGISQRMLADVFDLPRSRVASIITELSEAKGGRPVCAREGAGRPPLPTPPPGASVSRRWKFRRNMVIYVAYRKGFSQRALADVFDLPRSRVASIVKEFSEICTL